MSKIEFTNLQILRVAMGAWFFGWFIRFQYFKTYLFTFIERYPITFDFFPGFLQQGEVSMVVFFLPILIVPALQIPSQRRMIVASMTLLVTATISMLHLDTYNDATNVTCFWSAIWLLWFSVNCHRTDVAFRTQARFLVQLIVTVIFVGGFVGKITPAYLSGQAWFEMFMSKDSYFFGSVLRGLIDADPRLLSRYLSWGMIFAEGCMGLMILVPYRLGAICASVLMLLMLLMSNTVLILSVLGCLIGMMLSLLMWRDIDLEGDR